MLLQEKMNREFPKFNVEPIIYERTLAGSNETPIEVSSKGIHRIVFQRHITPIILNS